MSSSPPAAKKPRLGEAKKTVAPAGESTPSATGSGHVPQLTPELWEKVVSCCDFGEMVGFCAISKTFLKEVIPLVKRAVIESPKFLKPACAKRFSGLSYVAFARFFSYKDNESEPTLCIETIALLPLFVANLRRFDIVYFLGVNGRDLFDYEPHPDQPHYFSDENSLRMRCLIESLCGLYVSKVIPQKAVFKGILDQCFCTHRPVKRFDNDCEHCKLVCRCFDISSLVFSLADMRDCSSNFAQSTKGTSANTICLSPGKAMEIILGRPGCKEAITTNVLLGAVENRRFRFLEALCDLKLIPSIKRGDITDFLLRKVSFPSKLFDSLLSNGVPLKKSDFLELTSGSEEEDSPSDSSDDDGDY